MSNSNDFGFGTQIRKSPFFEATVKWGAKDFSVYNHMYIPRDFGNPEENFWNLINNAILCDVAVERQVQIKGPDASKFVQMMTPRDLSQMKMNNPIIVSSTDGVGTKIEIANMLNKFDTIGIDLVAMCVNDLIVQGA